MSAEDTRVEGYATSVLAERFHLGESARSIATDCGIEADDVLAAILWELWSREVRVAIVRRAVQEGRVS